MPRKSGKEKMDKGAVPGHIAIIMDGNGRWARARGLAKITGHTEGVKTVERVITACRKIGVKILTLYTFSTENWKRPREEVSALMGLLSTYLDRKKEELKKKGIRLSVIGDISQLPLNVRDKLTEALDYTADNDLLTLNLALNYGSRKEIIEAVRSVAREVKNGDLLPDDINEEVFSAFLYTKGLPDPDLLIRTSGEMRLSNFLLWQVSYTEIYVTETLWPDFSVKDFEDAIKNYRKRERRYGGR